MGKKRSKKQDVVAEAPAATPDHDAAVAEVAETAAAPVEDIDLDVEPEQGPHPAVAELEELRDQHLRLAAEFDNFRKRRAREQIENRERAQGDLLRQLLDPLDDLARVAHVDPSLSAVGEVVQGVELVERKLLRQLEIAGMERVGSVDDRFDPNIHEAVTSVPAETAEQDHTIAMVLQIGYRFHKQLLRPARVQVRLWSGVAEDAPEGA